MEILFTVTIFFLLTPTREAKILGFTSLPLLRSVNFVVLPMITDATFRWFLIIPNAIDRFRWFGNVPLFSLPRLWVKDDFKLYHSCVCVLMSARSQMTKHSVCSTNAFFFWKKFCYPWFLFRFHFVLNLIHETAKSRPSIVSHLDIETLDFSHSRLQTTHNLTILTRCMYVCLEWEEKEMKGRKWTRKRWANVYGASSLSGWTNFTMFECCNRSIFWNWFDFSFAYLITSFHSPMLFRTTTLPASLTAKKPFNCTHVCVKHIACVFMFGNAFEFICQSLYYIKFCRQFGLCLSKLQVAPFCQIYISLAISSDFDFPLPNFRVWLAGPRSYQIIWQLRSSGKYCWNDNRARSVLVAGKSETSAAVGLTTTLRSVWSNLSICFLKDVAADKAKRENSLKSFQLNRIDKND